MAEGLFQERADWVGVLERMHARDSEEESWAADIVDQYAAGMARGQLAAMSVLHHDDDFRPLRSAHFTPARWRRDTAPMAAAPLAVTPEELRALYYPPAMVCTVSEIHDHADAKLKEYLVESHRQSGIGEAVAIAVHPAPNVAVVLWSSQEKKTVLTRTERSTLMRVGLHLESSYRLRLQPEAVVATLGADGRVQDRTAEAPTGDALGVYVRRVERARSKQARGTEAALELWPALIDGRMSLVESAGRSRYAVVSNPTVSRSLRALTRGELDVLMLAIRGMSSKLIAYALGISSSRVSMRLQSAAGKVGLLSRVELVRVAAMLVGDRHAQLADPKLTMAEREILDLLTRGLSNREIAQLRSRSVRTVANQVVALLRKTGADSRRSLVTRVHAGSA